MRVGCWVSGKERNPTDNSSAMTSPQGTQESNGHVTKLWSYEPQLPPPPNTMPKILSPLSMLICCSLPPRPSSLPISLSCPLFGLPRPTGATSGRGGRMGKRRWWVYPSWSAIWPPRSRRPACVPPQRENKATQPRPRVPPARSPHRGRSDGGGTGTGNIFSAQGATTITGTNLR